MVKRRLLGEAIAAVVGVVLVVVCWRLGVQRTYFSAADHVPAFTATFYRGPWLFAAMLAMVGTGWFVVNLLARICELNSSVERCPVRVDRGFPER